MAVNLDIDGHILWKWQVRVLTETPLVLFSADLANSFYPNGAVSCIPCSFKLGWTST